MVARVLPRYPPPYAGSGTAFFCARLVQDPGPPSPYRPVCRKFQGFRVANGAVQQLIRGLNLGTGILGAGATLYLNASTAVYVSYDQFTSDLQMQHTGSGGVRVVW